ncbi:MAG TPA: hypothetical protein VF188_13000 [Longimicrobiales bacterium]
MVAFRSARAGDSGEAFRFRVSDAVEVPLRGVLLRLRLLDGAPSMADLRPGRMLRLRAPDGEERWVRIQSIAVTGGRATQARLDRTRELDVVISKADAQRDGRRVGIGWLAVGAAAASDERAA